MSSKQRTYPVLPTLSLRLPNGSTEVLTPYLCTDQASEFVLTLSLGVDGDRVTWAYTLGLSRLLEKCPLDNYNLIRVRDTYAERVRAKIKLDAILKGSDLWLINSHYTFPQCEELVLQEPEEVWIQMVTGKIRQDNVVLNLVSRPTTPTAGD